MVTVKLTDDEIAEAMERALETRAKAIKLGLPPYSDMPLDQFRDWVTGRPAAAAKIDVETCEVAWCYGDILDPYGLHAALGDAYEETNYGRLHFVRSPESDGWVESGDLSEAQREALDARFDREKFKRTN